MEPWQEPLLSGMNLYLEKWLNRIRIRLRRPPLNLFHYTTVEGLQGIVRGGRLHATAAYYLNDSSEIDYGYRRLASTLRQWFEDDKTEIQAGQTKSVAFIPLRDSNSTTSI